MDGRWGPGGGLEGGGISHNAPMCTPGEEWEGSVNVRGTDMLGHQSVQEL